METLVQPRGDGAKTGEKLRQQEGAFGQVQHPPPLCSSF